MNNDIGNLIKKIRKENNLTQNDIAKKYNVTFQAVSKWENGKSIPDIETLKKISKDYNISIDNILNGINQNNPKKKTILIIIIVIIILATIFIIFFKTNSFEFKKLSSSCSDFKVNGSISYNNNKTSIYISNIEYCKSNNELYDSINCSLYEISGNSEIKISEKSYDKSNKITLTYFLKDLSLEVDNYSRVCKNYEKNNLYLKIDATKDGETTSYKIPLILDSCAK